MKNLRPITYFFFGMSIGLTLAAVIVAAALKMTL